MNTGCYPHGILRRWRRGWFAKKNWKPYDRNAKQSMRPTRKSERSGFGVGEKSVQTGSSRFSWKAQKRWMRLAIRKRLLIWACLISASLRRLKICFPATTTPLSSGSNWDPKNTVTNVNWIRRTEADISWSLVNRGLHCPAGCWFGNYSAIWSTSFFSLQPRRLGTLVCNCVHRACRRLSFFIYQIWTVSKMYNQTLDVCEFSAKF